MASTEARGLSSELRALVFLAAVDAVERDLDPTGVLERLDVAAHGVPGSNVDVYVRYLRKKLGDRRIATVRGMGYRFDAAT